MTAARNRLREAVGKPLDPMVAELEATLVFVWEKKVAGEIAPNAIPSIVSAFHQTLKKVAPPPPKKVKFDAPLRKVLPLAESSVRAALDVVLLLEGLVQVGDFTEQTDKERQAYRLFLDAWRRMIFESAKIASFDRFRAMIGREERVIGLHRFSRSAAIDVLEGLHRRRTEKFASVPDVSMIACARCGGFKSRERLKCGQCRSLFCTRCFSPERELCLMDYAARYAGLDPETRRRIGRLAADLCRKHRLDPHLRNDSFVAPLQEMGVDVAFQESTTEEGTESEKKGRRRLVLRPRESSAVKRFLFAALYRATMRVATQPTPPPEDDPKAPPGPPPFDPAAIADPLYVEYFVDTCMGLALDEALGGAPPTSTALPSPEAR